MSLKLALPFFGVVGTIGGLVGATYSFKSFSKGSSINDTVVFSKKPIEVSFKCAHDLGRGPTEGDDFTFKWAGELGEEEIGKLSKEQGVEITGDFWFFANKDESSSTISKFTQKGAGDVYLFAELGSNGKFNITLSKSSGGSAYMETEKFWCNSEGNELKRLNSEGDSGFISLVKMNVQDSKTLKNSDKRNSKMKVSLMDCVASEDKKTSMCNLQISDVTGKKWSFKFSKKENYYFPSKS